MHKLGVLPGNAPNDYQASKGGRSVHNLGLSQVMPPMNIFKGEVSGKCDTAHTQGPENCGQAVLGVINTGVQ